MEAVVKFCVFLTNGNLRVVHLLSDVPQNRSGKSMLTAGDATMYASYGSVSVGTHNNNAQRQPNSLRLCAILQVCLLCLTFLTDNLTTWVRALIMFGLFFR